MLAGEGVGDGSTKMTASARLLDPCADAASGADVGCAAGTFSLTAPRADDNDSFFLLFRPSWRKRLFKEPRRNRQFGSLRSRRRTTGVLSAEAPPLSVLGALAAAVAVAELFAAVLPALCSLSLFGCLSMPAEVSTRFPASPGMSASPE